MQVAFYFAGEITQVLDAIPWVRCASGNVLHFQSALIFPDGDLQSEDWVKMYNVNMVKTLWL